MRCSPGVKDHMVSSESGVVVAMRILSVVFISERSGGGVDIHMKPVTVMQLDFIFLRILTMSRVS